MYSFSTIHHDYNIIIKNILMNRKKSYMSFVIKNEADSFEALNYLNFDFTYYTRVIIE